jgi:hypothetical protein
MEMLSTIESDTRFESAVNFYREYAGCGHDPATETAEFGRLRGAMALADAESWAGAHGREIDANTADHRTRVAEAEEALRAMRAREVTVRSWAWQDSNPRHEG